MVVYVLRLVLIVILVVQTSCFQVQDEQSMFWHLTDLHYDLNYSIKAGDRGNMCWNTPNGHNGPLGEYGDYSCDSPQNLVTSVLHAMIRLCPNPKFILWTGDDTAHAPAECFSLEVEVGIMAEVTKEIRNTFQNITIVPVLGNHDSYPKQQFSSYRGQFYSMVADLWKDMLQEGYEIFKIGGYYSKMLPTETKIKAVCLNTPLYYDKNPMVNESDTDPAGQFAWLQSELTDASAKGYKVYLVAHVPTGMFERKVVPEGYSWMKPQYNKRLNSIITDNYAVIAAVFFGHHHTDSFRVFYDNKGTPLTYGLIAPAVTPWNTTLAGIGGSFHVRSTSVVHHAPSDSFGPNNPGVRLFQFNTSNGDVTNYWQYFLDLEKSNKIHEDSWELEYDFLKDFNETELSAQSLHALAQTFNPATGSGNLFQNYFKYNSVSYVNSSKCDMECQRNHYCAITEVDYGRFRSCNKATDNKNNKK